MAKKDLTQQDIASESNLSAPTQPAPEDYSGVYKNLVDGLLYELCKEPENKDEPSKITHRLRVPPQVREGAVTHPGFFWEGTKEQFKETFERA